MLFSHRTAEHAEFSSTGLTGFSGFPCDPWLKTSTFTRPKPRRSGRDALVASASAKQAHADAKAATAAQTANAASVVLEEVALIFVQIPAVFMVVAPFGLCEILHPRIFCFRLYQNPSGSLNPNSATFPPNQAKEIYAGQANNLPFSARGMIYYPA